VAEVQNLYICHNSLKIVLMAEIKDSISVIGRDFEIQKMNVFLTNTESELVAMIGRRRVGKTFLIKKVYQNEMAFHITGMKDVVRSLQLDNFVEARNDFFQ
jgi:uncharacterized protein